MLLGLYPVVPDTVYEANSTLSRPKFSNMAAECKFTASSCDEVAVNVFYHGN